jgi:hypothetical protein
MTTTTTTTTSSAEHEVSHMLIVRFHLSIAAAAIAASKLMTINKQSGLDNVKVFMLQIVNFNSS